jgi:hypothetical protein
MSSYDELLVLLSLGLAWLVVYKTTFLAYLILGLSWGVAISAAIDYLFNLLFK